MRTGWHNRGMETKRQATNRSTRKVSRTDLAVLISNYAKAATKEKIARDTSPDDEKVRSAISEADRRWSEVNDAMDVIFGEASS